MNSQSAIAQFISFLNLKHNHSEFQALITAYDANGDRICESVCNCSFQYNFGYMETKLWIEWDFNDEIMLKLGLHGGYSTNFQNFEFDGKTLTVNDDDIKLIIKGIGK